jgi:hypothetical protein
MVVLGVLSGGTFRGSFLKSGKECPWGFDGYSALVAS